MEKHQYKFTIMNGRTGSNKCKTFWGIGKTIDDCEKKCLVPGT